MSGNLTTPVKMDDIASASIPGRPLSERTEELCSMLSEAIADGRKTVYVDLLDDEHGENGYRRFANKARRAAGMLNVDVLVKTCSLKRKKMGEIVILERSRDA